MFFIRFLLYEVFLLLTFRIINMICFHLPVFLHFTESWYVSDLQYKTASLSQISMLEYQNIKKAHFKINKFTAVIMYYLTL